MNILRYPVLMFAGLIVVLAGCAKPAPEFSSYVKPEVDFNRFESFRWQSARPETAMMQAQTDIIHRVIVQTIEEELVHDGLEKRETADLAVGYRITVSPQKSFWRTFFGAESVTPGSYNLRSAEAQTSSVDEKKLHKGVLIIELQDRKGEVVWVGRASAIVSEAQPGGAVAAVRKIMEDYPPL